MRNPPDIRPDQKEIVNGCVRRLAESGMSWEDIGCALIAFGASLCVAEGNGTAAIEMMASLRAKLACLSAMN